MKSLQRLILIITTLALSTAQPSHSMGLAARFGDVVVEHAQIGRTYNLRETLRIPFGIENRGNTEIDVLVEFQPPEDGFLNENYEAIPDPTWLKALPAQMSIGPKSQGFFDLLLSIPEDPALNGRHFQAIIKAKTVGTGLFGLAIENKLRFSIGPGPDTLKKEARLKAFQKLDFDVTPQTIYLTDIPVGRAVDAKQEQKKSIRVANYAEAPLDVKLSSVKWNSKLYKPDGYEPIPDPSWLTFRKDVQTVEGESIKTFHPVLTVPNEKQYRGKKYAALVRTGLATGFWLDAPVRVYFTTAK